MAPQATASTGGLPGLRKRRRRWLSPMVAALSIGEFNLSNLLVGFQNRTYPVVLLQAFYGATGFACAATVILLLLASLAASLCGAEMHAIGNPQVQARSLYEGSAMPVDSQIECDTVDESHQAQITVFAKLPKINIPTPVGNYNPDWAVLVVGEDGRERLYFVVETKGGLFSDALRPIEEGKIKCGKAHFTALAVGESPAEYVVERSVEGLLSRL